MFCFKAGFFKFFMTGFEIRDDATAFPHAPSMTARLCFVYPQTYDKKCSERLESDKLDVFFFKDEAQ